MQVDSKISLRSAASSVFRSRRFWLVASLGSAVFAFSSLAPPGPLQIVGSALVTLLLGYELTFARSVFEGDDSLPPVMQFKSILRRGLSATLLTIVPLIALAVFYLAPIAALIVVGELPHPHLHLSWLST